jgi:hypothetical protein
VPIDTARRRLAVRCQRANGHMASRVRENDWQNWRMAVPTLSQKSQNSGAASRALPAEETKKRCARCTKSRDAEKLTRADSRALDGRRNVPHRLALAAPAVLPVSLREPTGGRFLELLRACGALAAAVRSIMPVFAGRTWRGGCRQHALKTMATEPRSGSATGEPFGQARGRAQNRRNKTA